MTILFSTLTGLSIAQRLYLSLGVHWALKDQSTENAQRIGSQVLMYSCGAGGEEGIALFYDDRVEYPGARSFAYEDADPDCGHPNAPGVIPGICDEDSSLGQLPPASSFLLPTPPSHSQLWREWVQSHEFSEYVDEDEIGLVHFVNYNKGWSNEQLMKYKPYLFDSTVQDPDRPYGISNPIYIQRMGLLNVGYGSNFRRQSYYDDLPKVEQDYPPKADEDDDVILLSPPPPPKFTSDDFDEFEDDNNSVSSSVINAANIGYDDECYFSPTEDFTKPTPTPPDSDFETDMNEDMRRIVFNPKPLFQRKSVNYDQEGKYADHIENKCVDNRKQSPEKVNDANETRNETSEDTKARVDPICETNKDQEAGPEEAEPKDRSNDEQNTIIDTTNETDEKQGEKDETVKDKTNDDEIKDNKAENDEANFTDAKKDDGDLDSGNQNEEKDGDDHKSMPGDATKDGIDEKSKDSVAQKDGGDHESENKDDEKDGDDHKSIPGDATKDGIDEKSKDSVAQKDGGDHESKNKDDEKDGDDHKSIPGDATKDGGDDKPKGIDAKKDDGDHKRSHSDAKKSSDDTKSRHSMSHKSSSKDGDRKGKDLLSPKKGTDKDGKKSPEKLKERKSSGHSSHKHSSKESDRKHSTEKDHGKSKEKIGTEKSDEKGKDKGKASTKSDDKNKDEHKHAKKSGEKEKGSKESSDKAKDHKSSKAGGDSKKTKDSDKGITTKASSDKDRKGSRDKGNDKRRSSGSEVREKDKSSKKSTDSRKSNEKDRSSKRENSSKSSKSKNLITSPAVNIAKMRIARVTEGDRKRLLDGITKEKPVGQGDEVKPVTPGEQAKTKKKVLARQTSESHSLNSPAETSILDLLPKETAPIHVEIIPRKKAKLVEIRKTFTKPAILSHPKRPAKPTNVEEKLIIVEKMKSKLPSVKIPLKKGAVRPKPIKQKKEEPVPRTAQSPPPPDIDQNDETLADFAMEDDHEHLGNITLPLTDNPEDILTNESGEVYLLQDDFIEEALGEDTHPDEGQAEANDVVLVAPSLKELLAKKTVKVTNLEIPSFLNPRLILKRITVIPGIFRYSPGMLKLIEKKAAKIRESQKRKMEEPKPPPDAPGPSGEAKKSKTSKDKKKTSKVTAIPGFESASKQFLSKQLDDFDKRFF